MSEEILKTTWKQRVVSIVVAVILLGTTMAAYIALIINKGEAPVVKNPKAHELELKLKEESAKLDSRVSELSKQYYARLLRFRPEVKAYNAAAANGSGVKTRDLELGSGDALTEKSADYLAYYIGFCPDESIFDTSFNSKDNPTSLRAPIQGGNLIAGWNKGIEGMKLGGIREISMPGELAYGETREICGMKNSPLKFIVLTFRDDEYSKIQKSLSDLQLELIKLQRQ